MRCVLGCRIDGQQYPNEDTGNSLPLRQCYPPHACPKLVEILHRACLRERATIDDRLAIDQRDFAAALVNMIVRERSVGLIAI